MANQPLYSPRRSRGGNVPRPRRSRRPAPPGARPLAWLVGIALVVGGALVPVPAAAAPPQPAGVSAKTAYGSIEFGWEPVPGASAYLLEVSRSGNFTGGADATVNRTTYATSWIAPATLDLASETQLWYRVSAYGTGVTESTRGEPSNPQVLNRDVLPAPDLLDPANGATINYPDAVALSWSPVPGAVSYVVEYVAGEFDSSSATVVTATTTATTFVPQKPLTPGLSSGYQWRVRANYYNGSTSASVPGAPSATRTFKVEWPAAASRPTLISPANSGSNPIVSDPQLRWQPVAGAKEYRVLLGKSKDASGDIVSPLEATVTGTVYVPRTEFSNTNYYWQVVAYDANGGAGRPSEVWQFKKALSRSAAATTTGSAADVYPEPLTGSADPLEHPEIPLNELVLDWEPLPRATLYQVEVVPTNGNPRLTCLTASTSATIVASFASTGPEKDRLKGAGDCFWATKANERILPGTYTWRVRAVDYLGSATTKLQDSVADTAIVSEWSDREVSGQESRQRYFTITDPVLVNDQPGIKLDLTAFEAQKVPSLAGQPAPLLTWEPYDFGLPPGTDAAQRVGYEVTVYASEGSTTPVAVIRTPQTRLRINGVFDDNEVDEAYFASVRPFVYDLISRSWTSTTGLSYPGLGSADSFEWTKTSKTIDVSPEPQRLADGTVVLPWTPQFTTAPLDGGSRGYAITIRDSAEKVVGTPGYKVDLPFFVARSFASQNDSTGKPLPAGNYDYRVAPLDANGNATRYSAWKPFTVSYPAPTGSTTGATGASQLVTWGPSTAAFKYQLQYKAVSASSWTIVGTSSTTVGAKDPVQGGYVFTDLAPDEYRWQLRSVDTAGNVSAWSPEQTFTIGSPQLALTTADRAELPVTDRALRWSPVPGASRYLLEVSASQSFSPAFKYETVSTAFVPHESLTAGTAYYWRVKAVPELATSSTTRPILAASATRQFSVRTVPAAVKSPRATADGTALQVTWTPLTGAAAGTTAAPHYVIQVREKKLGDDWSGARTITTKAAAASSLITGLKSATAYEARVSAVNSEGQGPWSTVVSATTASAPSAAPSSLKITQGVASLTISWRAPTGSGTGGSPITGYVLRYRTGSGGWMKVTLGSILSHTLSGLKGNAQYAIEVAAVNAIGEGPAATATNTTLAGPGTVSSFKATRGDQSVKLTWRAPTSDGGSAVTGYVVEQRSYNAKTKKWSAWASTTVTTTSRTVTKLVNGTKYGFRVAAKTTLATGAYSALAVTPAGKPGASPQVTVKATKGKFTVSWKAAPNNGSALKSYVVQYSANGKKWTTLKTTKATVLKLTTTIGKKGKKYSFRVVAKNDVGTGAYSKVVQATRK